MRLDIRVPIGLMFGILGVIIAGYGLLSDKAIYEEHSLGINVNLWWGVIMILFAAVMLLLAGRARSASASGERGSSAPAAPAER